MMSNEQNRKDVPQQQAIINLSDLGQVWSRAWSIIQQVRRAQAAKCYGQGNALIGQHIPAHSFLESLLFQCDETDPLFADKN